jgi:sporulation-control protein spo0M
MIPISECEENQRFCIDCKIPWEIPIEIGKSFDLGAIL